jgi:hypothetical protein
MGFIAVLVAGAERFISCPQPTDRFQDSQSLIFNGLQELFLPIKHLQPKADHISVYHRG